MFDFFKNQSLKTYNTFHLDVYAQNYLRLYTKEGWALFCEQQKTSSSSNKILILGGGSNILFLGDVQRLVVHPVMKGIRVVEQDKNNTWVEAGAGNVWDDLVDWTVEKGLGGIENLSLIPGCVGASPVQNIGAYGVEAKDVIELVRGIDLEDGKEFELTNEACQFAYRNSFFKNNPRQLLITSVVFKLDNHPEFKLSYGQLKSDVEKLGEANLKNVREAVISIRRSKLPDVKEIGNAGSFFKNPVVDEAFGEHLKSAYPDMPIYKAGEASVKLAAGWLIEKAGWKGYRSGDLGVYDKQALVLVNYGQAKGKDIFELSEKIKQSVFEKFSVELEREVNVVIGEF
jgi:UDP-N-acetylmuramate dehydrogenase